MSGSSSKSEGYSSFLFDAAVPSTPVCIFIIFAILISYSSITGLYGSIFIVVSAILLPFSLILTAVHYKQILTGRLNKIISVIILIFTFSISGFFLNNKISNLISDYNYPEFISNTEIILEEVRFKRYSSELYFSTTIEADKSVKGVLYHQGDKEFNKGDFLFIHKKIHNIKLNSKNSFSSCMLSQGIHYTAGVLDNDITLLQKKPVSITDDLQKRLLNRIDNIFSQPASGVVKALLTGNQNYIEKNVIIKFRNSGVLHVLSASGMHVAIFAAIPAFFLIPFFRKNTAMLGSFLFVICYLYITDMPSSLLRAVVMFGFFYFQSLLFRRRNAFNYLMLTCSLILIISPWELFNPGFQLSFTATGGILIFFKQYRQSLKSFPGFIADTTAVTLSAQIFTIPVIIFHMNQFNTAGIISNIIVIPMITLLMATSLFSILVSFAFMPAAVLSGYLTVYIFKISLLITGFISDLNLNFFIYDLKPGLLFLLLINLIPLINYSKFKKLKFYPIIFSAILCTIYMKLNLSINEKNHLINSGESTAEIETLNRKHIIKLNLNESADTEYILSEIKNRNTDLKIIELVQNSNTGLLLSRRILNDYAIEEYRFNGIPEINSLFKKIIFQLEKDNVIVKFY